MANMPESSVAPMPRGAENTRCAKCGVDFHCGMNDTVPCWCATDFPAVISGTADSSCLCPRCLKQLVAAKQPRP